VLDVTEGCPRPNTLFVSLLWVTEAQRRQGLGRALTTALCEAAAEAGMARIRLAVPPDNRFGQTFGEAMGFRLLREGADADGCPMWIMERLTRRGC
jgi:ribosomal protein S18 acetylase RimI-like enzyme